MCGIAGYAPLDDRAALDGAALGPMLAALRHRGPDDEGRFCNGRVVLGHRRLAIVDPEHGRQPIAGARPGTLAAVNGEIYNHAALAAELSRRGHRFRTRSDAEVVAHAYDAWGLDFLERLDGMFALALWDDAEGRLLLARDRMGEKPLYFARGGGMLVFASELTALLAHPAVDGGLDPDALAAYLLLEYVPAPLSMIAGVAKLPAGGALLLEGGATRQWRYWQLPAHAPRGTHRDRVERVRGLLEESVRLRLGGDVPVGVFLSGGIDSGAIAVLAARQGAVSTFSLGFEDREFDERSYAREVAALTGIPHRERVLEMAEARQIVADLPCLMDEPLADGSLIPMTALCRFAREHVKVALGGEGSDELFAGYPMHRAHRVAPWVRPLPAPVFRALRGVARLLPFRHGNFDFAFNVSAFLRGAAEPPPRNHLLWLSAFSPAEQEQVLTPEFLAATRGGAATLRALDDLWESLAPAGVVARSARFDALTYLPGALLTKGDRAGMSVGLEVRSPFLSRDLVEFSATLTDADLMRGLTGKRLLREAVRDLLPPRVLRRPKKGFGAPLARWLDGPLRELCDDLLSPAALRREGIFRAEEVTRLLAEHRARRADHRKRIWTLLVFRLWQEGLRVRRVALPTAPPRPQPAPQP